MRETIDWGYFIPYMVTGVLNEHPRSAMKVMGSEQRDEFREFYDKMTDGTPLE